MRNSQGTEESETTTRRLPFSLVPTGLWKRNLRNAMGKKRWQKLRKELLNGRDLVCDVCRTHVDSASDLKGHEQWQYFEKEGAQSIAKLIGVSLVCELCHDAEHFGRIQSLRRDGEVSDNRVNQIIGHYCRVNGVSRRQFDEDFALALEEHHRRSQFTWLIEWGSYRKCVNDEAAG